MTVKEHGKNLIVEYTKDGGTLVSIATKSRNFKDDEKPTETDVSVREDVLANTSDTITGQNVHTYSLSGLDTDENVPSWRAVEVGETGTLKYYRRGSGSGNEYKSQAVRCTGRSFNSPYDNANDWNLDWKGTGAVSSGVV